MRPLDDYERDVSGDHDRRLSFGSVAEQYDRHRSGYPAEMFAAVRAYAGTRPHPRRRRQARAARPCSSPSAATR